MVKEKIDQQILSKIFSFFIKKNLYSFIFQSPKWKKTHFLVTLLLTFGNFFFGANPTQAMFFVIFLFLTKWN